MRQFNGAIMVLPAQESLKLMKNGMIILVSTAALMLDIYEILHYIM